MKQGLHQSLGRVFAALPDHGRLHGTPVAPRSVCDFRARPGPGFL